MTKNNQIVIETIFEGVIFSLKEYDLNVVYSFSIKGSELAVNFLKNFHLDHLW